LSGPTVSTNIRRAGQNETRSLLIPADATAIATLSRDLIETGLPWSWTPQRVGRQIRGCEAAVLVARARSGLAGFAIMHFGIELAHLYLLAVDERLQRRGIGTRLLHWLEASAQTAGIATIQLEVRASNRAARAFYRALGYEEIVQLRGYYEGREAAIRMARFLRMGAGLAAQLAPHSTPLDLICR
jgi:ribosomal-protein-alanine N-acetyltransferase